MIRKYIAMEKRKAVSGRLLDAKQAKRERVGVDADTLRWRALHPLPPAQNILDVNPGNLPPELGGKQE